MTIDVVSYLIFLELHMSFKNQLTVIHFVFLCIG